MKTELKEIKCMHCDKPFKQKKFWQRFCGKACRKAAGNLRVVPVEQWQAFATWREKQESK